MTNQDSKTFLEVAVSALPAALAKLVKLTGKRPKVVALTFRTGPARSIETYKHITTLSLGELIEARDTSWISSDNESNHEITRTYTAPAVTVRNTYNRHRPIAVEIDCGHITAEEIHALEGVYASDPTNLMGLKQLDCATLNVTVDLSLSRSGETPAPVEVLKARRASRSA